MYKAVLAHDLTTMEEHLSLEPKDYPPGFIRKMRN